MTGHHFYLIHHSVAVGIHEPFDSAVGAGLSRPFVLVGGLHPAHNRIDHARFVEIVNFQLAFEVVAV